MLRIIIILSVFPIALRYGLAYLFYQTVKKECGMDDCGMTGEDLAKKLSLTQKLPQKLSQARHADALAEIYTRAAIEKIRVTMPEQSSFMNRSLNFQAIALPLSILIAVFAFLAGKNAILVIAAFMAFQAILAITKFTTLNLHQHIAAQAVALLQSHRVPRERDEEKIALCIKARVWR